MMAPITVIVAKVSADVRNSPTSNAQSDNAKVLALIRCSNRRSTTKITKGNRKTENRDR